MIPISIEPQISTDLPLLRPGDRLKRAEFERRYALMPQVKKAQLINGVVHMAAAVRFVQHGEPLGRILGWLIVYSSQSPFVRVGPDSTVRLDEDNVVQPDAFLILNNEQGGQAQIDEDGYINGAPELVVEVAASTTETDSTEKFELYQRFGVKEYLLWRVEEEVFDWFVLQQGQFQRQEPDVNGLLKSVVFPGLWLDVEALLRGDIGSVLRMLQQGMDSPEHRSFGVLGN